MKEPKPIPRKALKPKRGTKFFDQEKSQDVWLYIVKDNGHYMVCTDQKFPNDPDAYYEIHPDQLKETKKIYAGISNIPAALSDEEKQAKDDTNDFFSRMALFIPATCMNCGKRIYASTKFAKRCVTAHILPKSDTEFPSLKTDPDNIFYLGAAILGTCTCHDDWDRKGAENRTKMPIYAMAIERFEESLKHKLTGHELNKAYTYLNIKWQ